MLKTKTIKLNLMVSDSELESINCQDENKLREYLLERGMTYIKDYMCEHTMVNLSSIKEIKSNEKIPDDITRPKEMYVPNKTRMFILEYTISFTDLEIEELISMSNHQRRYNKLLTKLHEWNNKYLTNHSHFSLKCLLDNFKDGGKY